MNTVFLLLAQYDTAQIPLERCCDLFGLSPEQAARNATRQALPVPAYKGKGKAPWLVDVRDLAAWLDERRSEARKEWEGVR
jgi:hypothetical protein